MCIRDRLNIGVAVDPDLLPKRVPEAGVEEFPSAKVFGLFESLVAVSAPGFALAALPKLNPVVPVFPSVFEVDAFAILPNVDEAVPNPVKAPLFAVPVEPNIGVVPVLAVLPNMEVDGLFLVSCPAVAVWLAPELNALSLKFPNGEDPLVPLLSPFMLKENPEVVLVPVGGLDPWFCWLKFTFLICNLLVSIILR